LKISFRDDDAVGRRLLKNHVHPLQIRLELAGQIRDVLLSLEMGEHRVVEVDLHVVAGHRKSQRAR
jgi:hypothetical protein